MARTAASITPGWLRSEMMLENFGVDEESWREAHAPPGFVTSESPRFIGRGVAALAADPNRARWNQQSVSVGELAGHYGFTDVDGTQPDARRFMKDSEANPDADPNEYR